MGFSSGGTHNATTMTRPKTLQCKNSHLHQTNLRFTTHQPHCICESQKQLRIQLRCCTSSGLRVRSTVPTYVYIYLENICVYIYSEVYTSSIYILVCAQMCLVHIQYRRTRRAEQVPEHRAASLQLLPACSSSGSSREVHAHGTELQPSRGPLCRCNSSSSTSNASSRKHRCCA